MELNRFVKYNLIALALAAAVILATFIPPPATSEAGIYLGPAENERIHSPANGNIVFCVWIDLPDGKRLGKCWIFYPEKTPEKAPEK